MAFEISSGFDAHERPIIAALYWQAFGFKLGRVLGPDARAQEFLRAAIDPAFALVARRSGGQILGIAGFKTAEGALVGGDFKDLQAVYGTWGAFWRGLTLSVVEREVAPDVLLMDGICVHENARGLGVGTALLEAVKSKALAMGKPAVRLDVIDSNPRAKALYLREGFIPQGVERTGPFRHVFQFKSATQMLWQKPAK